MRTVLSSAIEIALVPGPTRLPTGAVAYRPIFVPGTAKAPGFNHCFAVWLLAYSGTLGLRSARLFPHRSAQPLPAGSGPGTVTVINGPDWNSNTPDNCQPPTTWPSAAFPLGPGRLYTNVERKR